MDAKILRAAVSAALRVTVSTTLIGCGGSVISNADGAAGSNGRGGQASVTTSAAGTDSPAPYPANSAANSSGGNGGAGAGSVTAGASAAGGSSETNVAGMASAAGTSQAGEPASAGAPAEVCGGAVDACLTLLAEQPPAEPLSEGAQACCETVAGGLDELRLANAACFSDLDRRFATMPARSSCCRDPASWSHPACAPWGPPVPPELSAEVLRAWSLAA